MITIILFSSFGLLDKQMAYRVTFYQRWNAVCGESRMYGVSRGKSPR